LQNLDKTPDKAALLWSSLVRRVISWVMGTEVLDTAWDMQMVGLDMS